MLSGILFAGGLAKIGRFLRLGLVRRLMPFRMPGLMTGPSGCWEGWKRFALCSGPVFSLAVLLSCCCLLLRSRRFLVLGVLGAACCQVAWMRVPRGIWPIAGGES